MLTFFALFAGIELSSQDERAASALFGARKRIAEGARS